MITKKTKIILFDLELETYKTGTLKDRTNLQMPVCTVAHFVDKVCWFFQECYPNSQENPMYQDIDWSEIEANGKMEVPK